MKLFFSLFRLEIPCYILCATILIAALSTFLLVKCRKISLTLLPWIIACLYLMLYITVFSRSSGMDYSYHLQPFWSYGHIKDGYVETFYENIYNVLFFMPYGILLGLQLRILSLAKITSIGSLTSIVIELLQLISRTGCCETDDVIHKKGQGTGTWTIYIQIRNGEEGLLDIEEAAQKWGRGETPDPVIDHRWFFLPHPSSPARRFSKIIPRPLLYP